MIRFKKVAVSMVLAGLVLSPGLSLAQTNVTASGSVNVDRISMLRKQIAEIKLQIRALISEDKSLRVEAKSEARTEAKIAKENKRAEKIKDKMERRENKKGKECRGESSGIGLALGHLWASGWLKNNDDDCVRPSKATTTPQRRTD